MNNKLMIFDKPYISKELTQYVTENKVPVLDNETSRMILEDHKHIVVSEEEAIGRYNADSRVYTTSENALAWIYQHIKDPKLIHSIAQCKDKVKFREMLAPIYPDYYFQALTLKELISFDSSSLSLPVILKPAVGFFSVGVYTIYHLQDWENAVREIADNHQTWKKEYPESVVGDDVFIIEQYIEGDEYAVDAYFNEDGQPVIVNIMKHDFSGASDVSDRLYYTSAGIIKDKLEVFSNFLDMMNKELQATNFPVHIEIRVTEKGMIPIECNPMRFAGWCTTDITWFAFGFRTYDYYLQNIVPDWDELLQDKEDKRYGMVILDKPRNFDDHKEFDYQLVCKNFEKVLSIRKIDYKVLPVFGFIFTETDDQNPKELYEIMKSDLSEFLK